MIGDWVIINLLSPGHYKVIWEQPLITKEGDSMTDTAAKLHEAGVTCFRHGDYQEALQKFKDALALAPAPKQQAEIKNDLGVTYKELGDFSAAYAALNEAMAQFVALNDKQGQARTLGNRGAVLEADDKPDDAVEVYKQSAALFEESGESEMAMYVWQAVSRLRMKQKQYIAAIGAYEEGIENMPKSSLKRKIMQQILKVPGSLMGGGKKIAADEEE